ncbi:MAG: ribosome-associated translation inhibitor RaiA [Patescibacteria group bacterium]|jgi:putative sigma-54 modulation protein|nr:ribosome-associated translation inhibitor RaiA [Patescibacteria group bacterium]
MTINLRATNLELTAAITEYVQTKVDMLEKYLGDIQVINCDFEVEKAVGGQNKGEIFRAEINLQIPRELLRVEKTESDLYKAIDKVKDHVEAMIISYKEKLRDKKRGK